MKHFVNRILIYVCPEGTEGIYFPGRQRRGWGRHESTGRERTASADLGSHLYLSKDALISPPPPAPGSRGLVGCKLGHISSFFLHQTASGVGGCGPHHLLKCEFPDQELQTKFLHCK